MCGDLYSASEYKNKQRKADCEVRDVSDTELITMLRDHPEEGCRMLLKQYTGLVLAICRRKLGGCLTAEDLEELTADILFAFYQKREQISPEKGIRALLTVMASRRCIDRYRSLTAKPGGADQSLDDVADTLADARPAPDAQTVQNENHSALMHAVTALGEPDCEIILRKYFYGETAAEIGERLSMRTGTVEMRLTRARQKLKKMLGGEEYDGA